AWEFPSVRFVLAEGWYPHTIGGPTNVFYRSRCELDTLYDDAWLIVAPSEVDEGFGRVAVEAALRRRPVLVANRGGLPEAVSNIDDCIVFEGSVAAWQKKVAQFLNDEDYRARVA